MSVVTEEMHSAVLGAYMNRLMTEMRADSDGELDIPSRDEVEFILAAVAPLIAAQERARAIAIAQSEHSDAAQDIDMATQGGDEMGRLQSGGAAHAAARIAAAIRARRRDMSEVTEEMHKAVLRAYMARMASEMQSHTGGGIDIPSRDEVEFILAAVAPLIAKAERERCARVADAERHNTAMLTSLPPQSAAALQIAAAIRALD